MGNSKFWKLIGKQICLISYSFLKPTVLEIIYCFTNDAVLFRIYIACKKEDFGSIISVIRENVKDRKDSVNVCEMAYTVRTYALMMHFAGIFHPPMTTQ